MMDDSISACFYHSELIHEEWTPRLRFWKHIQYSEKGLLVWKNDELKDQYENIKTCLEESLPKETTTLKSMASLKVVDMLNDTDGTMYNTLGQNPIGHYTGTSGCCQGPGKMCTRIRSQLLQASRLCLCWKQ
jgi:hypothetical protein